MNDQFYRSLAEKRADRRDKRAEDQASQSGQMLASLSTQNDAPPEEYQMNDPVTQLLFAATPGSTEEDKAKLMMNAGQFGGAAGTALGGVGGAIAGGLMGASAGGVGALPGAAAGAGIGSGIGGALGTMAGGALSDVGQQRLDFKTEKQMEDVAKKEAIMSLLGSSGGGRRGRR